MEIWEERSQEHMWPGAAQETILQADDFIFSGKSSANQDADSRFDQAISFKTACCNSFAEEIMWIDGSYNSKRLLIMN